MNWNELWMYVKIKQLEYYNKAKIPPQERVVDELDSYDIVTMRRLPE
jgi:hypothetical protein